MPNNDTEEPNVSVKSEDLHTSSTNDNSVSSDPQQQQQLIKSEKQRENSDAMEDDHNNENEESEEEDNDDVDDDNNTNDNNNNNDNHNDNDENEEDENNDDDDDGGDEENDEDEEEVEGEENDEEEEEEDSDQEFTPDDEAERRQRAKIEEMRREQLKRLQKLKSDQSGSKAGDRFKYLLQQTEVFTHFMAYGGTTGSGSSSTGKGKRGSSSGHRKVMAEKEEDEELLRETSTGPQKIRTVTVSPSFIVNTTMRNYQLDGLNWLIKLYDNGVNGILADEMGLGKTLQTIAFLAYLKHVRKLSGPHLVIVPKSVIPNWVNQMKQWCPSLSVLRFHGSKDERKEIISKKLKKGKFDVCVTSFEVAIREKMALNRFSWKYLIIDEAHRIKNEHSVLAQCVRFFTSQNRLLLTGTPLQNNLHELWALLNFLLPEVFDNAEDFDAWFNLKEGQAETEIIDQLHKVLKPFLLRRLKNEVEALIPPKKEIYVECGMSKMQRTWYKSILTKDINTLKGGENMRLLNIVMQLRKCCNHPYLFDGAEPGPPFELGDHLIDNSGKMVLLHRLLKKLKEQGSRVLIFSQMTRMLDILEDYMYYVGYQYCRIDGQTDADLREQYMDDFNRDGSDKFAFLLSTRAGGLGINLATADTVIIFDSDWNPQADLQAQDRCHRIGQKKPVRVFRFITKDSIEEKIYQRAVKKLYLDAVVIQQGRLAEQEKKLSRTELLGMIKFGAEEVFRSTESTISDEDIDLILDRGEKKQEEIDKIYKQTAQNNLLNFSLSEDANLYEFEGLDYSLKPTKSLIIDGVTEETTEESLQKEAGEQAKHLEDIIISYGKKSAILYFKNKLAAAKTMEALKEHKGWKVKFCKRNDPFIQHLEALADEEEPARAVRRRAARGESEFADKRGKGPRYHDYQFLNVKRLTEIEAREAELTKEKSGGELKSETSPPSEDGESAGINDELEQLEAEKKKLLDAGFPQWTRKDFQAFLKGCERFGRQDIKNVATEVEGKTEKQVRAYSKVFWKRYKEIQEYDKLVKRIEKGESALQRVGNNNLMLKWKTQQYRNPWAEMMFQYGNNKGNFSEDEDRYIVCMTAKFGYGAWDEVKTEVRNCWEFRFDWFFRSRTSEEIKRRCDTLIRLIEKEYRPDQVSTEVDDVYSDEEPQQASTSKRKRSSSDATSSNGGAKKLKV